jgi:hypothetical protein
VKEKKRSLSHQISMLHFFQSSSGTHASPSVLLDNADGDSDDLSTVPEEVLSP